LFIRVINDKIQPQTIGYNIIAVAFDINLDSIRQFNFHSVFNYFSRNIAYFPD